MRPRGDGETQYARTPVIFQEYAVTKLHLGADASFPQRLAMVAQLEDETRGGETVKSLFGRPVFDELIFVQRWFPIPVSIVGRKRHTLL